MPPKNKKKRKPVIVTITIDTARSDYGGIDLAIDKIVNPATVRNAIADAVAKIPGVKVETIFT